MDTRGAHVLITGGSRGLGAALAEAFASRGARVTVVARSEERLRDVAERVGGVALVADLADPGSLDALPGRAESAAGPVDVLVNNAGIGTSRVFTDHSREQHELLTRLNLVAPMELTRRVVPGMVARGRGHVVNLSSLAGIAVLPGMVPYAASKAALTHFTSGLRAELRGTRVGTTVVEVGLVPTDMRDEALAHPATEAAFRRLYRLGVLADTPVERVTEATVSAVAAGRRHVRLPRRAALLPMLAEAPRRVVEILLTGLPARGRGPVS